MTHAEQFVAACRSAIADKRALKPLVFARALDAGVSRAWTDGFLFYYFADGSSAGTCKHDGAGRRSFQAWSAAHG